MLAIVYWAFQPGSAPEWTGFAENTTKQSAQKVKTLWDWMELLLVPLSLSLALVAINQIIQRNDQKEADEQSNEEALQEYLKEMSKLLLEHNLYNAKQKDEVRFIAMALTNSVLARLDGIRKGYVLNFLYSAGLINCRLSSDWQLETSEDKPRPMVLIDKADLSEISMPRGIWRGAQMPSICLTGSDFAKADLYEVNLSRSVLRGSWFDNTRLKKANLSGCDLSGAAFTNCNLEGADFSNANLRAAILFTEDLRKVKSLDGCIMYDGEVYDPQKPLEEQGMDGFLSKAGVKKK